MEGSCPNTQDLSEEEVDEAGKEHEAGVGNRSLRES
jgi:hypothetical protein